MQSICPIQFKAFNGIIIICLMMAGLSAALSCATRSFQENTGANTDPGRKNAQSHLVFISDEYIICKLRSKTTSASLAKIYLGNREKSWIIEDANEGIPFEVGQVIVIPLKQENKGGITVNGYQTVPVLGYYRFAKKCNTSHCISAHVFDQQMRYLKENGYRVVRMADFLSFLYYQSAIPKRSVVITINSAHSSVHDIASPILKKYGFYATLFVDPDSINTDKNIMTWDLLRKLKANGFEVGSRALPYDAHTEKKDNENESRYAARVQRDLLCSKKIIDKNLSQNTLYLAFPSDKHNQRLVNIFDQVGYKVAFTMQQGSNPFFSDPLSLKRSFILEQDMDAFIAKLKTFHGSPLR